MATYLPAVGGVTLSQAYAEAAAIAPVKVSPARVSLSHCGRARPLGGAA